MSRAAVSLVVGIAALLLVSSAPQVARWFGASAQPSLRFSVTVPACVDRAAVPGLVATWQRRLAGFDLRVDAAEPHALELEVIGATAGDASEIERALAAQGRLELRAVASGTEVSQVLFRAVRSGEWPGIVAEVDGWRHDDSGRSYDDFYLRGSSAAAVAEAIAEIGRRDPAARLPEGYAIGFETVVPLGEDRAGGRYVRSYLLDGPAVIDGSDVTEAMKVWDPQTNRPGVMVILDDDGARRFADFTSQHVGDKLAILLNGEIKSASVLQSAIVEGRLYIAMGGGSPDDQQAETDALVAVLSSPAELPAGIAARLTGAAEPSSTILWAIRLGVAAGAGLLAWLLAGLIARRSAVGPVLGGATVPRPGAVAVPAAITVGLLVVSVLLELISLPWLADWVGDLGGARVSLSVVAIGIAPVFIAFFLIEVIALLVPGWRARRRGTPQDRVPIDRAVAWLAVGLAALQAWFIADFLQSLDPERPALVAGLWVRIVVTASLVGGTMLLAVIAGAISRAGLINGWLALSALASARMLVAVIGAPASRMHSGLGAVHAVIVGLTALIVVGLVIRRSGSPDRRRVLLAGVAPLLVAPALVSVLAIPYLATQPGIFEAAHWLSTRSPWLDLGAAVAVALAWSWPRRGRAASPAAVAISVAAIAALGLLPLLLPGARHATALVVPAAVVGVAFVELLAGVVRRIRMPDAAVLIAVHDVDRADAFHDELAAAGIPVATGGVLARAALRFFGPYIPAVVYVPASRLDEATVLIAGRDDG